MGCELPDTMRISIIIPAYNEEKYIEKTLQAISGSDFKDYETIVVANGCTDKTANKSRKLADRIIVTKKKGVSMARNLGAKSAKGEILVFLDADILISKNTLTKIAEFNGDFVGTCFGKADSNEFMARLYSFGKNMCFFYGSCNGIIFCNKDLFYKTGGFDEQMSKGEESYFTRRARKIGKHVRAKSIVLVNMRRYKARGYFPIFLFWAREKLFGSRKEYNSVR